MKTDERVIGGIRYKMRQVGAMTGNEILLRLSRPAAALMSEAIKNGRSKPTREDVFEGFARALSALQPEDLAFVCQKLAEATEVWLPDGDTAPKKWPLGDQFDAHFAGRYAEQLQWLRWGIEMNRFFGSGLELISALGAESKSPSDPASTGGSGVSSSAPSA